ncbi:hypothetical protein BMF94_3209 [Rhodotorula taiwanensis]|uniref:DUF3533 domain-containing protein n=1 Tax=Rhodotorula taiwanensis TaxID=741276 RepID=A0A2S5BA79_9BASI|nr:hypothetical protein BMF94_3209 [Rhodotorula taiwanensis]
MSESPTSRDSETLHDGRDHPHMRDGISLWDPSLKNERKSFLKSWGLGFLLANVFMWAFLPIYWGSYFRQPQELHRLGVALVNLDSRGASAAGVDPALGPVLIEAPNQLGTKNHLGFVEVDNAQFDISSVTGGQANGADVHQWARHAVINEDYFGVIIANANATVAALDAYNTVIGGGTTQYVAEGALSMYYAEGRNFETLDQWVAPLMNSLINNQVLGTAATNFISLVATRLNGVSDAQYAAANSQTLASVISKPFAAATWNLRPIQAFAGIPATSVGMIYILIFTYFCSMFWNNARQPFESKILLSQLILLRIGVVVVIYLILSLWISLVTMAFRVDFMQWYGHAGFPLFWISNFMTMWALGMPMEIALSFLGPRFTAFLSVPGLSLALTVAQDSLRDASQGELTSLRADIADMSVFYRYGFAVPVYQAVQNGKAIIFGTKNRFGQYYGVLIAWIVVGTLGLVLTIWYQRKKAIKQKERENAEKKHSDEKSPRSS